MCGILAKVSDCEPINIPNFKKGLNQIRHRGPQGEGLWQSKNKQVAIGHTRLALTGQDNGRQPIANENLSIIASVNGEFYGYADIRQRLEKQGHVFRTDSDSEILVHLYEEHGIEFTSHLRGEFAFVLWDDQQRCLWAARDRFGIKPLHYCFANKHLTLASEAKAILANDHPAKWDQQALLQTFTHQYISPSNSLFDGIKQIPPAHLLRYQNQRLELSRYWSPPEYESNFENETICANEILHSLQQTVKERLHPSAAFSLSAGIDSSAIVSIASKQSGHQVPCFSVSFDKADYDEFDLISQTSSAIGADLHRIEVNRSDLFTHLSDAVYHSEGLTINGQLVGKFLLNKAIKEAGHQVVLSGEGADEAFLGYAHLLADHPHAKHLSYPLQEGVMLPTTSCAISTELPQWLGKWPSFLQAKLSFCQNLQNLLHDDFKYQVLHSSPLQSTLAQLQESQLVPMRTEPPMQSAYLWMRLTLANYILKTLGDGCEMPHSIEGRVPFLDHIFFEKAWKLPVHAKIQGATSKAILRTALRPVLPHKIATRNKHPFLAPPLLTDSQQANKVRDLLNSSLLTSVSFLDHTKIHSWFDKLIDSTPAAKQAADPILMTLLSTIHFNQRYNMTL